MLIRGKWWRDSRERENCVKEGENGEKESHDYDEMEKKNRRRKMT
jgi:hypothetical protein